MLADSRLSESVLCPWLLPSSVGETLTQAQQCLLSVVFVPVGQKLQLLKKEQEWLFKLSPSLLRRDPVRAGKTVPFHLEAGSSPDAATQRCSDTRQRGQEARHSQAY